MIDPNIIHPGNFDCLMPGEEWADYEDNEEDNTDDMSDDGEDE